MPVPSRVLHTYDHLMVAPFVRLRSGSFQPDWVMPRHAHGFLQLLCITAGRGVLEVAGEHPLAPGDIAVIPAGIAHAWRVGRRGGMQLVDVCLLSDDPRHRSLLAPLLEAAKGLPGGILRETIPLAPTLAALRRAAQEAQAFADFRVHGQLWQLLADIAQIARERRTGTALWADGAELVLVLERYLEQHHPRQLTLTDLADAVHVSPKHLCKVMARERGCTPMQRLMAVRLRHARDQLQDPGVAIADVGRAVGLRDHRHFARVFKAATGLSPSAYRAGSQEG